MSYQLKISSILQDCTNAAAPYPWPEVPPRGMRCPHFFDTPPFLQSRGCGGHTCAHVGETAEIGRRSRFRGRGMDFDEVRIYQPGDDVRSIDWRVTAKTQTPHTKIFREERERPVLVVSDLRGSMFFGSQRLKSVHACEVSAALVYSAPHIVGTRYVKVCTSSRAPSSR